MCQFYTNLMAYPYVLLNLNKWSCSLKLEITQVWHDLKKKKILDLELGTQDLITVPPRIHGMRLESDFNSLNLGFHI